MHLLTGLVQFFTPVFKYTAYLSIKIIQQKGKKKKTPEFPLWCSTNESDYYL